MLPIFDFGEPIAERIFCDGSSVAKRTASPLIPPARPKPSRRSTQHWPLRRGEGPAFSPLRGEGVALGAPAKSNVLLRAGRQLTSVRFRVHVFFEQFKSTRDRIYPRYRRAAWCPNFSKTGGASPSPLKGERAGVRGEAVR